MSEASMKNAEDTGKPYGDEDEKLAQAANKITLNVDAPVFVPSGGFSFAAPPSTTSPQSPSHANNESAATNTAPAHNTGTQQTSAKTATDSPVAASGATTMSNTAESSPSNDDVPDDWENQNDEENDEDYDEEMDEDEEEGESQSQMDEANRQAALKAKLKPRKNHHKRISEDASRKEHINVVFIGHVDAGKSTIGGQLLYLTGMVDKRTLEKYEREAKEKNRESWYLSWALDTNLEEREKGKTVEAGRAYFETDKKRFTLLDAPGHRGFVPNMIAGASQADLAVLVISARKGEFETGFERGGQTREHAMLAKTEGVRFLVVLINKMDDPTVEWAEERFNECRDKLLPYLKQIGFNIKTEVFFLPCSGLTGAFLKDCPPESLCPWYRGPSLLDYLDSMPPLTRDVDGPFKLPIVDKYKDMGTVVLGKVESGTAKKGAQFVLMPNRKPVEVIQLWADDEEVNQVTAGENVRIKLKGVEEEEVSPGFVLCDPESPCSVGRIFDAQVIILEHRSIICPGYSCVLHIHSAVEEVTLKLIACLVDKKTGEKLTNQPKPRFVKQGQIAVMRFECTGGLICMETFKTFPQMGRFNLRDEGRTIGIGKILRIVE